MTSTWGVADDGGQLVLRAHRAVHHVEASVRLGAHEEGAIDVGGDENRFAHHELWCRRIDSFRLARRLRKHRTALIALAVYKLRALLSIAFMGRVVSPNDVFYNYNPWSTYRPAEVLTAELDHQRSAQRAYFTLMTMVRSDWRTFHLESVHRLRHPRFQARRPRPCSRPFILLPALIAPMAWIYTVNLFLKLNASFLFAYLWLREERLGRHGAAVGAIVIAGAGVYAVRWLWQITNATVLYPALLWLVRRALNGKRTSIAIEMPIALAFALAGVFPAAMAYGAWIVSAYAAYALFAGTRRGPSQVKRFARYWR